LNKKFLSSKPFSYLQIDNLFTDDVLQKIIGALGKEQFILKKADLFSFQQTNDLSVSKQQIIQDLRLFLSSSSFIHFLNSVTGFKLLEESIDLHATLYTDTDYLLCHDDQLEKRKIAFMFYLSDLEKGDGGALELYHSENGCPIKVSTRIVSKKNSLFFFEVSPFSFHAVSELIKNKNRLTLAGWFHE